MRGKGTVIWVSEDGVYKITEYADESYSVEDLMGDTFDFEKSGYTGSREELEEEKRLFLEDVDTHGVFGYVLEAWVPTVGEGWTKVDSCWGFIGRYDPKYPKFDHDIVDELKDLAAKEARVNVRAEELGSALSALLKIYDALVMDDMSGYDEGQRDALAAGTLVLKRAKLI